VHISISVSSLGCNYWNIAGSTLAVNSRVTTLGMLFTHIHTCVTKQCYLIPVKGRWCSAVGKLTTGLMEIIVASCWVYDHNCYHNTRQFMKFEAMARWSRYCYDLDGLYQRYKMSRLCAGEGTSTAFKSVGRLGLASEDILSAIQTRWWWRWWSATQWAQWRLR